MKRLHLQGLLLVMMLCALCVTQASALEYSFDTPKDYLFAQPTSDNIISEWENPNVDRSKNTALAAPGFGTPTSYLPGSGEYLTPNLVPGAFSGGLVNAVGSSVVPSQSPTVNSSVTMTQIPGSPAGIVQGNLISGYTEVTNDLYYAGGYLGTLKILSIGVNVKVYQGTDSAALAKGAGHFEETSIWSGNICVAGHNRGTHGIFGDIHTLRPGDKIIFSTRLGTRTYEVTSVSKVLETDRSGLAPSAENQITLYTCVQNQSAYRWCVQGVLV